MRTLELFYVIDHEQAEELIEQHNRYEYRGFVIFRGQSRNTTGWFIYYRSTEVHAKFENREPVEYATLAEALNECSLANMDSIRAGLHYEDGTDDLDKIGSIEDSHHYCSRCTKRRDGR